MIYNPPKGTNYICVKSNGNVRYIKVWSDVYFVRLCKRPRQDFSYWHESERAWVWLGLIDFEQYCKNHKFAEIIKLD